MAAGAEASADAEPRQLLQHVLLDFRAEALEGADLLRFGRLAQVLDRRHPELVVEAAGGFRSQAGDVGDLDQGHRELLLQLRRRRDLTGREQRVDFFGERLADAGNLGGATLRRQLGDRDRALADRARRRVVRREKDLP